MQHLSDASWLFYSVAQHVWTAAMAVIKRPHTKSHQIGVAEQLKLNKQSCQHTIPDGQICCLGSLSVFHELLCARSFAASSDRALASWCFILAWSEPLQALHRKVSSGRRRHRYTHLRSHILHYIILIFATVACHHWERAISGKMADVGRKWCGVTIATGFKRIAGGDIFLWPYGGVGL